ncbi:GIY-YIG nuclease family protein [Roseomonas rosulenta]|uniref:GIY-YIG nuclease family protein n=1 Tax=Roseomonas rosulenta TaxID=2748667 RepID=UPI0018DFD606|nr:GIY-YIG nuclease family protein [Roseomonas rosulenta]
MMPPIGRSLELYYIDGRPDGMLTAELFNWTGHVLMAPRTQIAAALRRPEASYAGIYLLIGELDGEPRAYVGEGEDISARIRAHDTAKDWWTTAVLITTAGNKLNKAHVRYLEARLIAEARAIGRVPLDNSTSPPRPSLSEAETAKMEAFLENLLIVLPAVRVDMFIRRTRPAVALSGPVSGLTAPTPVPTSAPSARFVLESRRHGIKATATLTDGEFIVEANSRARLRWEGQANHNYAPLHDELSRAGILAAEGEHCRFTENYAFRSPSAAAAVVLGRQANGPNEWRDEASGMTYREWEAHQLSTASTIAGS